MVWKHVRGRPNAALLRFQYADLHNVKPRCSYAPEQDGALAASGGVASKNYRASTKVVCVSRSSCKIVLR